MTHHPPPSQRLRTVLALGWSDFVLKYRGSVLGYLWSLVAPLTKFLVILYVFQSVMGVRSPQYPLSLFLGIIIWEHFANTTNGCMAMLWDKAAIIQKLRFPRILLPLAVGWTNVIVFGTYAVIFVAFLPVFGGAASLGLLYAPVALLQMTLLALGVGMLLSAFALKYRDIGHLWDVGLQILFWLTPVAYPSPEPSTLAADAARLASGVARGEAEAVVQFFIRFQPLSLVLTDARRMFLSYPDAGNPLSPEHVLAVTAACAAVFAAGAAVFRYRSRYFVQEY